MKKCVRCHRIRWHDYVISGTLILLMVYFSLIFTLNIMYYPSDIECPVTPNPGFKSCVNSALTELDNLECVQDYLKEVREAL